MKYYRAGTITGFVWEEHYVIEEKKWWGWKTIVRTDSIDKIHRVRKDLESKGGIFL